ncbi:MAG: hypothetical protein IKE58_10435 [Blautia sp.]|nr:hypothetical protein [Blautia sp.]
MSKKLVFAFLAFALLLGGVNTALAQNHKASEGQNTLETKTVSLPQIGQVKMVLKRWKYAIFP